MIHPLFRLLVSDPQLIAEHVEAYSELMAEEVGAVTVQWKRRAMLVTMSLVCMFVTVVLAGVAMLLWAVVPLERMNSPWGLLLGPCVPLVLGLWAWLSAKAPVDEGRGFRVIKEQLAADAAMLRSVTAP